jgi:hypothetical protein
MYEVFIAPVEAKKFGNLSLQDSEANPAGSITFSKYGGFSLELAQLFSRIFRAVV